MRKFLPLAALAVTLTVLALGALAAPSARARLDNQRQAGLR